LLYVTCSRPRRRLAVLFTQELTDAALATLTDWFGEPNVYPLGCSES
jgi:DNA helicase-2/ATP-dependent DNA helicase PcrA